MKQIKDFAVSSQEAGFDEFLKVFNEYFKLSCRGEFLFYGASDGQPQRDDIRWTNKFILPQEAIALLTGKQLTEGDFAHVSEHQSAMEYLQTPSLKEMESQPEIVPVQEEVGAIAVIISDNLNPKLNTNEQAFFIAGFEEAVKYFKLNQQTAHLQQQLKEAKELLEESFPIIQAAITLLRVAPNNNTLPEPPHDVIKLVKSINQFLTRNQ